LLQTSRKMTIRGIVPPSTTGSRQAAPAASTRLTSGPATATRYSWVGPSGSFSISDTPPSRKITTRLTGMPKARLTAVWPSSWASRETASSTANMNATAYDSTVLMPSTAWVTSSE
jgi:hypothetical protein